MAARSGRRFGAFGLSLTAHVCLALLIAAIAWRVASVAVRPDATPIQAVYLAPPGASGASGGRISAAVKSVQAPVAPKTPIPVEPAAIVPEAAPIPSIPSLTASAQSDVAMASLGSGVALGPQSGFGTDGAGTGPGAGPGPGFGNGAATPGAGISDPIRIREVEPNYTTEAMQRKLQGVVALLAVVGIDGRVSDVKVVQSLDKGPNGLDEQAVIAAKKTQFVPAMKDGKPVAVIIRIEMLFSIRN